MQGCCRWWLTGFKLDRTSPRGHGPVQSDRLVDDDHAIPRGSDGSQGLPGDGVGVDEAQKKSVIGPQQDSTLRAEGDAKVDNTPQDLRRGMPTCEGVYVQGEVNNAEVVFIIDTGASVSMLSREIFDRIKEPERPLLRPSSSVIRNAEGRQIATYGEAVFSLRMANLTVEKCLIVADLTDDVLVGADMLQEADLLLSQKKMVLQGQTVPLVIRRAETRKVTVARTVTIPGMTEMVVDVTLKKQEVEPYRSYCVEACPTLMDKYRVVMASSLVDVRRGPEQKVRVLNPFPRAVTLHRKQVVGTASPVEEVEVLEAVEDVEEVGNLSSLRRIRLATRAEDSKVDSDGVEPPPQKVFEGRDLLPDHVREMFDAAALGRSEEQKQKLAELFAKNADVFSRNDTDLGCTNLVEHVIDTGDSPPLKSAPRRIPLAYQKDAEEALQKMYDAGTIRESTSPWSSPLVFVRKKNGQLRPCVDYRKLNMITKQDAYPLPRIQDCLDALAGAQLFSSMDITSAYNQIPVREEDIPKTAFVSKYGLFEFLFMPFGMHNATATFQRMIELAAAGLQWQICLIYLDDILVFSQNFDEHLDRLGQVFDRLRKANLKLKPAKCHFLQEEIHFLGHVISKDGVSPNPENIEKVLKWPRPRNVKEVQSFLGLANYYRRFVAHYSYHVRPLVELTKKTAKFEWTKEQEEAFNFIKFALLAPPILGHPQPEGEYILDTDACDVSIGAVLSQIQNGEEIPLAFGSKALGKAEKNYCVTDKELLAVRYFVEYYRCYLLGRKFTVRTDHRALKWLLSMKEPKDRVARWIEALSEFTFAVEYRSGEKHGNADALSRCPDPWDCKCKDLEQLRCGPCRKCQRKTERMEGKLPGHGEGSFLGLQEEQPQDGGRDQEEQPQDGGRDQEEQPQDGHSQVEEALDFKVGDGECMFDAFQEPSRGSARTVTRSAWPVQLTHREMAKLQEADSSIGVVYKWMKEGEKPSSGEVSALGPEARHYWLQWDSLELSEGLLYRWFRRKDGSDAYRQLLVPGKVRREVLYHVHDSLLAGHLGTKKTRERVLQRFYWFQVREDVDTWVAACEECARVKEPARKTCAPLGEMPTGAPMDRLSMDILGPFPESSSGNKYVLVVIDNFTRWVEIFALPDQTAETCANKVLNEVISRFGCPYDLHSDQGRNFESGVFQELCTLLELRKTRSSPGHPRGNGQVERFNKTLVRMIKSYIRDQQEHWDKNLGCLAGAYRSAVNESTGFTPNFLMLGREVKMPLQVALGNPPSGGKSYGPYVMELKERMFRGHQIARDKLQASFRRQKDHYDAKSLLFPFDVGDIVWYASIAGQTKVAPKLRKTYIGPVLIMEKLSPLTFRIQVDREGTQKVVHHNKLLRYRGERAPKWCLTVKKRLKI